MVAAIPRVLVIDDEPRIRLVVRVALTTHHYDVSEAETGHQGLVEAVAQPPDVVRLDIGLPDMDGFEVLRQLRRLSDIPVIMFSARGMPSDISAALDAGASDFLAKPFDLPVLLSRINAALPKADAFNEHDSTLTVGDLRIDTIAQRVFNRDIDLRLTPTEYHLLAAFVKHPGKLLTYAFLLAEISKSGSGQLPGLPAVKATVYHGLPRDLHQFRERRGEYLAFLGRMSPEKRVDRAIEIARQSGMPLKIAAKIYPEEKAYFHKEIEPLLDHSGSFVDFIGEVGGTAKDEFLGNAAALVFPIDWAEPFGLVMIEALACGTPVIGWRNGSVPEIIDHGTTGFVVESIDEAVDAVRQINRLHRPTCRRVFESRFNATRMA